MTGSDRKPNDDQLRSVVEHLHEYAAHFGDDAAVRAVALAIGRGTAAETAIGEALDKQPQGRRKGSRTKASAPRDRCRLEFLRASRVAEPTISYWRVAKRITNVSDATLRAQLGGNQAVRTIYNALKALAPEPESDDW